jgi:hypothetical protein
MDEGLREPRALGGPDGLGDLDKLLVVEIVDTESKDAERFLWERPPTSSSSSSPSSTLFLARSASSLASC